MKKSVKIFFVLIALITLGMTRVYAADNSVTLTSSATNVKTSDTITVTVTARSDKGIEGLDTVLKFNSQKLEFTNEEEISEDGLSQRADDNDPGVFLLSSLSNGRNTLTKVLKFKVLETAQVGEELDIELVDIDLEDSEESDQPIEDQKITLTVVSEQPGNEEPGADPGANPGDDPAYDPADDPTDDPADNPTEGKENLDKTPTDKNNAKKDNTAADKSIDKAGISNNVILTIGLLVIVTVVSFIGYKKYNNI